MKILGIVAEYDPFHNGHLYHLTEAKKQVSPDLTYIVLSPVSSSGAAWRSCPRVIGPAVPWRPGRTPFSPCLSAGRCGTRSTMPWVQFLC